MTVRARKIFALFLAGWLLLLGNSYAWAVAFETQHDLELAHSGQPAKTTHDAGSHGCAGHLSAHILALEQTTRVECACREGAALFVRPDARIPSWRSKPVSPPPNSLT